MNGANSALEVILMAYPKEFLFGANGPLGPRMSHILPHKSGSVIRIFLQFYTMKEATTVMEI